MDELLLDHPIGGSTLNLSDDTITEETLRAAMRHAFKESLNTRNYSAASCTLFAQRARIYQQMLIDLITSRG